MKLEVKNLKKFKDFTAVKNINFYIDEGQTLGVLGLMDVEKQLRWECSLD